MTDTLDEIRCQITELEDIRETHISELSGNIALERKLHLDKLIAGIDTAIENAGKMLSQADSEKDS